MCEISSKVREMLDWSHMLDVVAATKPRFLAGEGNAYQALTFGWLVGGVLEKQLVNL